MMTDIYSGNMILEVGDTILDIRDRIGIVKYINTGYENDCRYWEAMIYYPKEDRSYTTYINEIKYVLTPFKFN